MDPSLITAFAGLAGAVVGGLTSFATTWLTQRSNLRDNRLQAEHARLVALFDDFISEASRLYADALSHEKDSVADLVNLYALESRLRLVASDEVIRSAEATLHMIARTYREPNRSLAEMHALAEAGGMDFLIGFGDACRHDLQRAARPMRSR